MNMKNNYKKIIFLGTVLFIILVISIFLTLYNNAEKEKLFELRKEVANQSNLPEASEIEKNKDIVLIRQKEVKNFLFDKDNPVEFIEIIENIAKQNILNVSIDQADFFEKNEDNSFDQLKMSVSLNGSVYNIRSFIKDFENVKKETDIQSVRMFKNESEESVFWTANLILIGKTK